MKTILDVRSILWKGCLTIILTLFLFSGDSYAQIAKIEPDQPRWGQTLTITYNPNAEGAKLTLADDIYVVGFLYFSGHFNAKVWAKMMSLRRKMSCSLPLQLTIRRRCGTS